MPALRACLFVSIILLALPLTASSRSMPQAKAAQASVFDLPMLPRGSMPAVEVMVDGQGPFLFAIDTGASGMARVDSSLVERLRLPVVDKAQASDGSGRNPVTLDVVELDSITIGGAQFKNVRAATRNYNVPNRPKIDGVLGFNLFADYLLTLDFPAKRVRLERGELTKPDGAEVLSFESLRGIPTIELSVGSYKINAHLDSGNMVGGFILPTSLVDKLTIDGSPVTVGRARTVSGETEIKQARLKESIRMGRFEFKQPTIQFPALSDSANVGAQVLREFAITFDQKNKRLRLKRSETRQAPAQKEVAAVSATGLKDYTGLYGERTISEENGALFLQRPGGMKLRLVGTAKDEFTLEGIPQARLKFIRDADQRVVELDVLNREGVWEKSKKQ